jgi:AcrR family transcriptional regulator
MNGPKTRRGQASRGRIVEAAADLMFTRGVRGTGLDDVLTATGVGKGQFYHYFPNKEALVRAVIARQAERILDGQRQWPDPSPIYKEAISNSFPDSSGFLGR